MQPGLCKEGAGVLHSQKSAQLSVQSVGHTKNHKKTENQNLKGQRECRPAKNVCCSSCHVPWPWNTRNTEETVRGNTQVPLGEEPCEQVVKVG